MIKIVLSGIISLIIALLTFKKQWKFYEMLKDVDDVLNKDFKLLTPKRIFESILKISIALLVMIISILIALTYFVYDVLLGISSMRICISYFLSNLPCSAVIIMFYFSSNVLRRRNNLTFDFLICFCFSSICIF